MKNKIHIKRCLGVILFLFFLLFHLHAKRHEYESNENAGILIISSYSPIKENGNHIISSFIQHIQQYTDKAISVEYMNCEAMPDFTRWTEWMKQMFQAYNTKPSVVVLLGNEAWATYRETCDNTWNTLPIVLGCVPPGFVNYKYLLNGDFNTIDKIKPMPETFAPLHVTGYYINNYLKENLLLIKQLRPEVEQVAFCFDNHYDLPFVESYVTSTSAQVPSVQTFTLLGSKLTTTQLLDTLARMGPTYAILSGGWYTDVDRYPHAYSMLHNELSRYTDQLIFQTLDQGQTCMDYLGGYFVSGENIGKDLASLTYQVLTEGIENALAFQQTPSRPMYYINYPVFKQHGLDFDRLPAHNVVFYNKKPSALAAYPAQIGAITLFVILILWLWQKERRHKKEMARTHTELSLALDAGYMAVWRYSVSKGTFIPLYKQTIPQKHMSKEDMRNNLHPKDQLKYDRFFTRLLSGEEERSHGIFRLADPSGHKSYEVYAIALKGNNGQVYQIIGTERNITDLMRQQQEYKENKQMLEFTMHAFKTIAWEYLVEKRLLSISNTFSRHFNPYHKKYILLDDFLRFVHPDDRSPLAESLDALENGRMNLMMIQIRTKSPEEADYRWFEMNAVTYRYEEDGRPCKIIGLKHDITDIKRTQELIRLRQQAEDANRMKSTFLANMSHDIRTPLNAIVGFSTLLSESNDKEEQREFADIIQENTEILLHLINDILDITKIEAGRLDFMYSDVNLTDIFRYLEHTYKFRLKKGVQLVCILPEESFFIHSEKNRLTQVISNFLSNACKYTFEGSITMGYEIYEDHLRLYVSDTGKGIAAENLPHVFDRFAKFDPTVQGTGLGLSICQLIVETLGGEIGVDSELGKGSTFWFTLPRKRDSL